MADYTVPMTTKFDAPTRMPLVARKDLRDRFENNKPEIEKFFSDTLGGEWKLEIDTNGVWSYSYGEKREAFGKCVADYFGSYMRDNLKQFIHDHGEDGKQQICKLAPTRTITLEPGDEGPHGQTYASCDFKGGRWRFIFNREEFGVNPNQALAKLGDRIVEAEQQEPSSGNSTISLAARKGIRDEYDTKIGEFLDRTRKYLKMPDLEFVHNFEHNFGQYEAWERELRASPDEYAIQKLESEWQRKLGRSTLSYFKDFVENLRSDGFFEDDMLQEGFQESVHKGQVTVKIVPDDTFSGSAYSNAVIDDSVLVLRTNAEYFGKNTQKASKNLIDLL